MDDLVWDLTDFSHESNDFWDNGQVLIKGDSGIAQVVIEATKGDSDEGYVAVDSVFFVADYEECETKPSDAITTNTPTTTENAETSTSGNPTTPGPYDTCTFKNVQWVETVLYLIIFSRIHLVNVVVENNCLWTTLARKLSSA